MDTATVEDFEDIDNFLAGNVSSLAKEVTYSPEVELIRGDISNAVFFGGAATDSRYFLVVDFIWKESDNKGLDYQKVISLYRNRKGDWVAARRLDKMIKNRFLPFLVSRKKGFTHSTKVPHEYAKRVILREFGVYKEAGKTGYAKKMRRLIAEHTLA